MSSSQETLDGTPEDRLTHSRLQSLRETMFNYDSYLGKKNNTFLKDVSWQFHERAFHVFPNQRSKSFR